MAAAQTFQVEPNILVSHESALPKIQMMVVADPKDAKHLLGTAIAATPVEDVCTIYVSMDRENVTREFQQDWESRRKRLVEEIEDSRQSLR